MLALLASLFVLAPSVVDCPPGPEPGEVDALPLVEGDGWTFDYRYSTYDTLGPTYTEEGTLRVVLDVVTCADGRRTVEARERRVGLRYTDNWYTGGVDTTAFDTRREVAFVETAEGVQLPWSTGTVPRYVAETADTVQASAGLYSGCATHGATAWLAPGEGLVEFSGGCTRASHSYSFHIERGGRPVEAEAAPSGRPALAAWPNPSAGRVTLRGARGPVAVYSLLGRLVRTVEAPPGPTAEVDLRGLDAGTYVLRTADGAATVTVVGR